MRKWRPFVPALILFLGTGAIVQTHTQRAVPPLAPVRSVMPEYEGYQVSDQVLSQEEIDVAGMTDYVARAFRRDSVVAFTTLVSYYDRQTQGRTIHSPRNCLPGAGWEVLSPGSQAIVVGGTSQVVNHYLLKKGPQQAVVLYWYQGRGRIVANEYRVKWNLLKDAAFAGHTEEALVRVVVPITVSPSSSIPDSVSTRAAESLAAEVAVRLAGDVDKILPKR
jgi:EpsI family protein